MKQLTVYCSRDLEDRVVSALERSEVEGFLRIGAATGNKFLPKGQVPRVVTWDATMFLVPAARDEAVAAIVRELQEYVGACEIEPCLRMVIGNVQEVH